MATFRRFSLRSWLSDNSIKKTAQVSENDMGSRASTPEEGVVQSDSEEQPTTQQTPEADPFGDERHNAVKYKTMNWWNCGILMIAETISLGILSLPKALATLGLIPGLMIIVFFGALSVYTGYCLMQFKLAHPQIASMGDAGHIVAGRVGREVLDAAQIIVLTFICGAHVLSISVAMNAITGHATCSLVFGILGAIVSFFLTLPRKFHDISYLSFVSFASITGGVMICMVGVGVTKPDMGNVSLWGNPTGTEAIVAILNIVVSYAGHVAFFGFMSELKRVEDFPKALYVLQSSSTTIYIVAAVVIYWFAGNGVVSPALGSTTPILKKVAYGIALPSIIIAGVVNGHCACKSVYMRIWKGTKVAGERSVRALSSWIAIVATLWILGWVIASSIPVFHQLLALMSALFCSWFSFGLSGVFWLHLNKGSYLKTKKKMFLTILNCIIFCIGGIICVAGLYATGLEISHNNKGEIFSCADNSLH